MPNSDIKAIVHYIAAGKPYDADVSPTETVGKLKAAALQFFGLVEDGNKTYKLFYHKTELSNPSETIGQIDASARALNLQLEEFITQGE